LAAGALVAGLAAAAAHEGALRISAQAFQRALEEALELQARRAGRPPATSHRPVDFLAPNASAGGAGAAPTPEADALDLRPAPVSASAAKRVSAARAAAWLRAAARADAGGLAAVRRAEQACPRAYNTQINRRLLTMAAERALLCSQPRASAVRLPRPDRLDLSGG